MQLTKVSALVLKVSFVGAVDVACVMRRIFVPILQPLVDAENA